VPNSEKSSGNTFENHTHAISDHFFGKGLALESTNTFKNLND
jgi:hypothetical protein